MTRLAHTLPWLMLLSCGTEAAEVVVPVVVEDSGEVPTDTAPPEDTAPEEQEPPEQVGGPDWQPELIVDEIGEQDLNQDWLFNFDAIHEINITLPPDSYSALVASPYDWASGVVEIDGITLEQVGVRLRGKVGSFRTIDGKPKFKLDFGEYVDGQTFYGLDHLSLNNAVVDCGFVKETVAMEAFRAAGVPAPRTAYTKVSVNGEDYGLYVVMEAEDKVFLEHNYDNPEGELYDGKYVYYGPGSYTLLDFTYGVDNLFQLEEGPDNGFMEIKSISSAINNHKGQSDFFAELGKLVDWEAFHREQLVEQFVGQNDGYGLNRNNYRLYFDPDDGKVRFIPWDMDYAFLEDYQWGRSWRSPTGVLAYWCMADATCQASQKSYAQDVLDEIEAADLDALLVDILALTEAEARSDPKRECAVYYVDSYRAHVQSWLTTRPAYMTSFWGL